MKHVHLSFGCIAIIALSALIVASPTLSTDISHDRYHDHHDGHHGHNIKSGSDAAATVPAGVIKKYGGIDVYQSPVYPFPKNSGEVLLLLSDIAGLTSNNTKLLADSLGHTGLLVLVPDLFNGEPWTAGGDAPGFDEWLDVHNEAHTDAIISTVIKSAREVLNPKNVGVAGYCFGGKYAIRLAGTDQVDAAFSAHPSRGTVAEAKAVKKPLVIAAGEKDTLFGAKERREVEDVLIAGNKVYQMIVYAGVDHGFAIRGNDSVPLEAWAKRDAMGSVVRWTRFWFRHGN